MSEKFERHIAKPKIIKLKNEDGEEDTFTLQPLRFKDLPKLYAVFRKFASMDKEKLKEEDSEEMLKLLDEETITLITELVSKTLKYSYPEEDEASLEAFGTTHLMDLLGEIIELNSPRVSEGMKHELIEQDSSTKNKG